MHMCDDKYYVEELKVKELKAKEYPKLHTETSGKTKDGLHMYDDKVEKNADLLKADVVETKGVSIWLAMTVFTRKS